MQLKSVKIVEESSSCVHLVVLPLFVFSSWKNVLSCVINCKQLLFILGYMQKDSECLKYIPRFYG